MKSNITIKLKIIILAVFTWCITSCTNNSVVIPKTEYPTKIIGQWMGTVGDLKETMTLNSDSTFTCQVYSEGFIANTLSQGVKGTVSGKWNIQDSIITLNIMGEKNENLKNKIAISTIISLKENELVLKSDNKETSLFERVKSL